MKTFGLDIEINSIKIASIKKDGTGYSVESIAMFPLVASKGLSSESSIDQQMLADSIRECIKNANIKENSVNISLNETQIYTKIIVMPDLSEKELEAALRYEMEQYIPMPLEQVRTDWQILSKNDLGGKKTMNVLLVAAPKNLLEKYEFILKDAGLVIDSIETDVISIHRALFPLVNNPYSSMIVHIGDSSTSVSIVRSGVLATAFSSGLGGIAISRAVSLDLGIDYAQAENYTKTYGFNKETFDGKIGKALVPVLESLVGDLKKAILSYNERSNSEGIKQIILSGDYALIPGIDAFLTNRLNIQVVVGNTFKVYNMKNVPPQIALNAPTFNIAVGLALRDL